MSEVGWAELRRSNGRLEVIAADDVIGFSLDLLGKCPEGLSVDDDGLLLLAGNPDYRYRPMMFVSSSHNGPPTVLVCERARADQ